MAKRIKKNSKSARSLLKLEALEQRQLLAGGFTDAQGQQWDNIVHSNGNVYDQVLMKGSYIAVNADPGEITRVSFLDLEGDIVQAEFSGAGTLSITLDTSVGAGYEAGVAPEKYLQQGIQYVQGVATFTIQGSDATTNFSVFSVGKGNAANPNLFDDTHTGGNNTADVTRLNIVADPNSPNGSLFGGIRAGNAVFAGTNGPVGISAANVQVQDVVIVGDINATEAGTPTLVFGAFSQFGTVKVAGGDLVNAKSINNAGYGWDLNLAAGGKSDGTELPAANTYNQLTFTTSVPASVRLNSPQTLTLTAGIDNMVGGSSNDTFIGNNDAGTAMTLSTFDNLDGGAGSDSLSVSLQGNVNVNLPTSVTIKNIESAMLTSSTGTVTATTTGWTGLTSLTTNSVGGSTVTAATTTDIIASDLTLAATAMTINGGKDLTVTTAGTTGTVSIGATTAPKGTVSVTHSATVPDATTTGTVQVKGGTTVTIAETVGSAVNTTTTIGDVTVTGTTDTTTVSVTQPAAQAKAADKIGIVNGGVTINDVNNADGSKADTITTVTLGSFGAAAINSSALSTVTLSGKGTSLGIGATENSGVSKATALQMNLNGLTTTGAVTLNDAYATLNIAGASGDSTLNTLATKATELNISGEKKVTISTLTLTGSNPVITTSGTGGVVISNALGTGVTFTGGEGADSITLSSGFTKAITTGAGNDTVVYGGAAGTGGSVAAGEGTDTIVMTAAQGQAVSANSTFNSKFSGFETLRLSDDGANTVNLGGINSVANISLAGTGSLVTIDNVASGATVTLSGAGGGGTLNVANATFNAADVLNVGLSGNGVTFGTVTASGVETVNINSVSGTGSAGSAAAGQNTLTLADANATSVVVTGSNGLKLINTGNAALASFDASAVAGDSSNDTAANLGVAYASAYTGSSTTSIKGGAGNDILSGNAKKDNLQGGAGVDWLYSDNAGTKRIETYTLGGTKEAGDIVGATILGTAVNYTVLAGDADMTAVAAKLATAINTALPGLVNATSAAGVVTVNYMIDGNTAGTATKTDGTTADLTNVMAQNTAGTVGAVANDSVSGGAGNDLIVSAGGGDTLTGGDGKDKFVFLKAASNLSSISTITDFTTSGDNADTIVIGDVEATKGNIETVQDLTVYGSLGAAADAAAALNTTDNGLVIFTWGNDSYMYVESTGANASYTAGDFLLKLTGSPLAVGASFIGKGIDGVV